MIGAESQVRGDPPNLSDTTVLRLVAPLSGVLVPLTDVPDPVFAQKLVGDGVSIDPVTAELLAPCDGRVLHVHRAGHALTLTAAGLEIMIHIGLDTVNLKGEGFTARVRTGDEVRAGDVLISFDADFVATHARSLLTQIIVTNPLHIKELRSATGKVQAGRDVVAEIALANGASVNAAMPLTEGIESDPVIITNPLGLHARPAAVIAARARQFTCDLRLVKGDRIANARSILGIMGLEIGAGDEVRVVAHGADAEQAIAALTHALETEIIEAPLPAGTSVAAAPAAPPPVKGELQGVPAAPGVGVGQVFHLRHEDAVIEERAGDPERERRDLDAAIATALLQLEVIEERLVEEADRERAAIFGAHRELLKDPELNGIADAEIRRGASAAFAWRQAYRQQVERLRSLGHPLLAGRAADMRDVGRRVLHLLIGHTEQPPEYPRDCIIVADELTPSETAAMDRARVRGICSTMGSATSHVAILARGLGIPAVAAIDPRALDIPEGTRVILDGNRGTLNAQPSPREEREIRRQQSAAAERHAADLRDAHAPAMTRDGQRVDVVANIGAVEEAGAVIDAGGEGVGLLRTEFLFMERSAAPDEDEQTAVYESIAHTLGPDRRLIIRALDVGGDKALAYFPNVMEENPFLGERGIRLLLNRPEVMRTQLRAILRAAASGQVAVMFPMIATLAEWRTAREMLVREARALGRPVIPAGIMVETSAAALLAPHFARDADFFSIGTNDLTQYTLAMDRTNPRLAKQMDALHPAVLRLIAETVAGARAHQRGTAVCGAVASDPDAVPVLIGLGVHELSVNVPSIPAIKARVRALSLDECQATAQAALQAGDAEEVRALVQRRHGVAT